MMVAAMLGKRRLPSASVGENPTRQGYRRWWACAWFASALAFQAGFYDRSVVALDEGQLADFARRIASGEVLYRDIYTGITPAVYYLAAGLFRAFGDDLLVLRSAQAVINALSTVLVWHLALAVARPPWALLPPVLYLATAVLSFPVFTMLGYSSLGLLLALAAVAAALDHGAKPRWTSGLALGLLLGLQCVTKQNYGILVGASAGVLVLLTPRSDEGRGPRLGDFMPVAAGVAAVGFSCLLAFAAAGALDDLLHYTVVSIFSSQLEAFDQPIPPLLGDHPQDDGSFLFLYLPGALLNYIFRGEPFFDQPLTAGLRTVVIKAGYLLVLAGLAAGPLAAALRAASGQMAAARRQLGLAVFAGLFFLGLFPSAIWSHLASIAPPAFLGLAGLGDALENFAGRRHRPVRIVGHLFTAVVLLATLTFAARFTLDLRRWNDTPLPSPRATLRVGADVARLYGEAISCLEQCAAPGEPIFVTPHMPILYFLVDRPNPTRYDMAIPGDVDTEELIGVLRRAETRCAVHDPRMYVQFKPLEDVFPAIPAYLSEFEERAVIEAAGQRWRCLEKS
jgi:hypothetical protein